MKFVEGYRSLMVASTQLDWPQRIFFLVLLEPLSYPRGWTDDDS
jgi:hypothetical protein